MAMSATHDATSQMITTDWNCWKSANPGMTRILAVAAMAPPAPASANAATSAARYQFDVRTLTRQAKNNSTVAEMRPVNVGSVAKTVGNGNYSLLIKDGRRRSYATLHWLGKEHRLEIT